MVVAVPPLAVALALTALTWALNPAPSARSCVASIGAPSTVIAVDASIL
jgi:hypothetical protein